VAAFTSRRRGFYRSSCVVSIRTRGGAAVGSVTFTARTPRHRRGGAR